MSDSETAFPSESADEMAEIQAEVQDELSTADDEALSQGVSAPFVGQWQKLISQTNWEKGRIIYDWRIALIEAGANVVTYSDEAWAKIVGGITSQHVGRLRRVHERFGDQQKTYKGLYWSHFLAAIDWDDAEMWLEGATQSDWSVSEMRRGRWQAMGADPNTAPTDEDSAVAVVDEDYAPLSEAVESDREERDRIGTTGPLAEGPDFGDEDSDEERSEPEDSVPFDMDDSSPLVSPFASLPELPVDIADALEQFKLAVVRHRAAEWSEISRDDMLRVVDAIRAFILARAS
jgi:hypothetical protein